MGQWDKWTVELTDNGTMGQMDKQTNRQMDK